MVLITFILLFITLLVYTLTSENKQKALLISLGLVVSYVACTTSFFTTLVLWENASSVPAFATLLLILIIIVLFVYILVSKKKKRAWLISLGIIATYHFVVFCNCGPNIWDIRVMKPMAKAISNYIVKHGIPKSLNDIPNLPYRLEGCKREEYYQNLESYDHVPKEKADLHQIREICYFTNVRLKLRVTKELDSTEIGGNIRILSSNETVLVEHFNTKDGEHFKFSKIDIGSSKTSGICSPMRQ